MVLKMCHAADFHSMNRHLDAVPITSVPRRCSSEGGGPEVTQELIEHVVSMLATSSSRGMKTSDNIDTVENASEFVSTKNSGPKKQQQNDKTPCSTSSSPATPATFDARNVASLDEPMAEKGSCQIDDTPVSREDLSSEGGQLNDAHQQENASSKSKSKPVKRRRPSVRFADTLQQHEAVITVEDRVPMYWTSEEKEEFKVRASTAAEMFCEAHTAIVHKLENIYVDRNCHRNKEVEEDHIIRKLHKVWVGADHNVRGFEYECCDMIQTDWENAIQAILQFQDVLLETVQEGGWEKLMRRRSLDLSLRARKFAALVAEADALEAKKIYKEGNFLRIVKKQLASMKK